MNLNSHDWQNLIYLGLLLIVLSSSLFLRRNADFGKITKYLGAWSVIGLVAIICYSYRFEFSALKNRVLSEINPSKALVKSSGEMVISLAQDGHFYLDLKINGRPMRFMIDTGASDIVINISDAERLGIDRKTLNFNKPYQTANGKSWGASITLKEIEFGNVKFKNVSASVNSGEMGIPLLGMSFLRQFERYEFYRDKLILTI